MVSWLTLAITVILVAIAFLVLNRSIRTRTSQQAALDEIKREVGAIITELNQTTERNIEIVEDRVGQLEELIRQADGRLRALRRDLPSTLSNDSYDSRGIKTSGPLTGSESSHEPETEPTPGVDRRPQGPPPRADRGPLEPIVQPEAPTLRERVRGLYLQGLPLERIATIVGKSIGEIELIVSLEEGKS